MSTQRGPDDPSLLRLADGILIPPFPGTTAPRWLLTALEGGLAGVTLFSGNVADSDQLAELTERLRSVTAEPLIAIDEEGGDVTRIAHRTGSPYPGNAALGAADDPELTRRVYRDIGADLAAAGVNVDLAPSVDVNTALDNPVIGTRAFGAEAELVSHHAAAAIAGLHAVGVAACAKHFPGHGSTREDSHDVLATVPGGLDVLWLRDLPPFKAAIAAGVKGVMTGHLRVPELTGELPATLSHAALTGLLRNQLGFGGVIVTDALEMRGIQDARGYRGMPECAVLAVAAGADLLCLGRDQDEQTYLAVRAALARAAANGVLPGDRLEEAAARVGELRGWLAAAPPRAMRADGDAGLVAARRAARLFAVERSRTQPYRSDVREADAPAAVVSGGRPLVVQVEPPVNIAVGAVPWGLGPWLDDGDLLRFPMPGQAGMVAADAAKTVLDQAAGRPIITVVRGAHRDAAARDLVREVLAARPDAIVVEMGLPIWRPKAGLFLATYGAGYVNCQVAAEILGLHRRPNPA